MSRGIVSLIAILTLAAMAYCAYFAWATSRHPDNGLEWLQEEYAMTDELLSKVKEARARYLPECRAMCQRLAEARSALSDLAISNDGTAEQISAAYSKVNSIEEECVQMSLKHVFEVTKLLPHDQAERYRERMVAALLGDQTGQHEQHSDRIHGGK